MEAVRWSLQILPVGGVGILRFAFASGWPPAYDRDMASEELIQRILRFVGQEDYRPQRLRRLAQSMGIAENEYGEFHDAVKALAKSGRVVQGSSKVVSLPDPNDRIIGLFRLNPRGFGFVIPDSAQIHGDLYVPPGNNAGAITGDTVQAKISKQGKRDGKMMYEGRITRIIARGRNQFVGELHRDFGRWFVRPDGKLLHGPVFVDDPGAKSARAGDQVVIEVTRYPEPGKEAQGVIVRVLGKRGEPEVDTLSMIIQYQLPEEFPPEVLDEASNAASQYGDRTPVKGRENLRDWEIITIDPDDARDFDDAISIRDLGNGRTELGVHIADVSHFVPIGSALDTEARRRANSVYFPRFVIPMLPETLSNGVCSLQEDRDRLTKSAFITYDRNGVVLEARFANTVIRSSKRLTYRQATAVLDGKTDGMPRNVVSLIGKMDALARAIRKRRIREGMLVLELPGVDLVFDDNDNVIGVQPEDTSFSHTIIEMFMVEANEAVGRLLAGLGVPHLRRIHPEPNESSAESLAKFLGAVGMKPPKTLDRFALQKVLARVEGRPESFAVNLAVLRSMQQAEYSPKLIGHFALAGKHYVHFTSPIRRYPDLTVHRLLDAYFAGQLSSKKAKAEVPSTAELTELGEHCSQTERRAEDAERELRLVKILRLLEGRKGESFEGVVTGVTNFGIFVQLREFLVDGLLRYDELSDDWWEVDTDRGCVVAERSGRRIAIGQVLSVTIILIDVASRQMDLTLSASTSLSTGTPWKKGGRAKVRVKKGGKRVDKNAGKAGARPPSKPKPKDRSRARRKR